MINILLVGTIHEEKGSINVNELVKIMESACPEVIFLEVPKKQNDKQHLNGINITLESKAVKKYCEIRNVELVNVDLPTPELTFFRNNKNVYSYIESLSREYCRIIDWHSQYLLRYGFSYLNSIHCDNVFDELDNEIKLTVERMKENKYTKQLELWNQTIELRDLEMLKNIEEYCENHDYRKGLFLVGAAHRRSIMKKVDEMKKDKVINIEWSFIGIEKKSSS